MRLAVPDRYVSGAGAESDDPRVLQVRGGAYRTVNVRGKRTTALRATRTAAGTRRGHLPCRRGRVTTCTDDYAVIFSWPLRRVGRLHYSAYGVYVRPLFPELIAANTKESKMTGCNFADGASSMLFIATKTRS